MATKRKAIEGCPPPVPVHDGECRWHASKGIVQLARRPLSALSLATVTGPLELPASDKRPNVMCTPYIRPGWYPPAQQHDVDGSLRLLHITSGST